MKNAMGIYKLSDWRNVGGEEKGAQDGSLGNTGNDRLISGAAVTDSDALAATC